MKNASKRLAALGLSLVMAVGVVSGGLLGTHALGAPESYRDMRSEGYDVIYGSYDADGNLIPGNYVYAEGMSGLYSNPIGAYKFDSEYFAHATNSIGNVYYDLTGTKHTIGSLICGGEVMNPAQARVPVYYHAADRNFYAGPYYTAQGQKFFYADAPAINSQGAVGDGNLQGPEPNTRVKTDITVQINEGTGVVTPTPGTDPWIPAVIDPSIVGPNDNGDYFKPVEGYENVYEVVTDKTGTSQEPPEYVLDKDEDGDGDPATDKDGVDDGTDLTPLDKYNGGYYVEDPDNIYHEVQPKPDASGEQYDPDTGIWGGGDGQLGGSDDAGAVKKDNGNTDPTDDWYVDMGQNVFKPVKGAQADALVGGGMDKNPATDPVVPIYEDPYTGKYYVGPVGKDDVGNDIYYGDPCVSPDVHPGSDGLLNSTASTVLGDDTIWYKTDEGMTRTKPTGGQDEDIKGPDDNGDYFKPTGTPNVYEKVEPNGDSKVPPEYVYDTDKDGDGDPATDKDGENDGTDLLPVEKTEDGYYVEDPDNIYHKVDPSTGNYDEDDAIWGGEDGKLGTGDDDAAKGFDTDGDGKPDKWYVDNGDNTFVPITSPNNQTANDADIVGGGEDENPTTGPVKPIYTDPDTGKHYVGPVKDKDGNDVYYGDPAAGGNGKVDSETTGTKKDDIPWYMGEDGKLTPTKPGSGEVTDKDGNKYRPSGENPHVYEKLDDQGKGTGEYIYDTDHTLDGGGSGDSGNFQEVVYLPNITSFKLPGDTFTAESTVTAKYFLHHNADMYVPIYATGVNYKQAFGSGTADPAIGTGDETRVAILTPYRTIATEDQDNFI